MALRAKDEVIIFSGSSNPTLAEEVCRYLGTRLASAEIGRFSDGEIAVEITENVRGGDVFVVQSTCPPANDHLMELLLMLDALRRASARRITAVLPYYGYARQDRKVSPRVPISAKLVADLITTAGADTRAHHGPPRRSDPGLLQHPRRQPLRDAGAAARTSASASVDDEPITVVSPDAGGVERARAFAKRLDASLAIIDKRRAARQRGRRDEHHRRRDRAHRGHRRRHRRHRGHALPRPRTRCVRRGRRRSSPAARTRCSPGRRSSASRSRRSTKLVVTDTIPLRENAKQAPKIAVLSVAHLIGEAIRRIHNEESISSLFI